MSTTRDRYAAKILRVQTFIQKFLDDDLSLERLAEVAGYSPCHFHRVFRGIVGESLDDYVRRLRLERGAQSLRYRRQSILEVALDAGYGSHEAFTRAFSRMFGVTPSEYQSLEFPPQSLKEHFMQTAAYTSADIRIEKQPPRRLACLRVVGPYSFETLNPAFGRICQWGAENGYLKEGVESIGVYYDDPEVTAPEKQRADVGITVGPDFQATGDIQVQTLPGGLCAVLRHKGHYATLGDAYRWLYAVWLPESGRQPGTAPPYEVYINDASQLPPAEWLTEICIPLSA